MQFETAHNPIEVPQVPRAEKCHSFEFSRFPMRMGPTELLPRLGIRQIEILGAFSAQTIDFPVWSTF